MKAPAAAAAPDVPAEKLPPPPGSGDPGPPGATSKPVHYHVLVNMPLNAADPSSAVQPDDLQALCYRLSHVYCRCTRSVKVVAPVYYAHLVRQTPEVIPPRGGDMLFMWPFGMRPVAPLTARGGARGGRLATAGAS